MKVWGHFPDYRSEVIEVDVTYVPKLSLNLEIARKILIHREFCKWLIKQTGDCGYSEILDQADFKNDGN